MLCVPVERVQEFIYLGSKQNSNGYCQPDVLRSNRLACSVMNSLQRLWKCSSLSINTKVHLYQALVMSVLLYGAEIWTLLVSDMNALEAFHMRYQRHIRDKLIYMSPMQRYFSDLVCQPLVTFYVVDAYLCLAMLYAWTREYQHAMLCV